ncbi:MAG: dissimilatory-type sulfite reductase subunit beta [Candidatus Hydrothermarchaeaceae archaeon]
MPGVGIPSADEVLPPIVKRNYGRWVGHEFLGAGVYKHVSDTGEECITVRVGMPSNARVSVATMQEICDVADRYADGYFRVTTRNHIEFVGVPEDKVDGLTEELGGMGLPVGGTRRRFHHATCCTGWLHCQIAAIDSPSIAKAISDELYQDFIEERFPSKLKISIAGCMNQCGEASTADIGVVGIYREAPVVEEEKVKGCEVPTVVAVCPVGAIRATGRQSISINEERCMGCGYCPMACEAITMRSETAGAAIVAGGKAGNTGAGPAWAKVAVPFVLAEPPRYGEITSIVNNIISAWSGDAMRDERLRDWISRIGWEKFFEKTSLPMTGKHIDGSMDRISKIKSDVRFRW